MPGNGHVGPQRDSAGEGEADVLMGIEVERYEDTFGDVQVEPGDGLKVLGNFGESGAVRSSMTSAVSSA